MSRPGAKAKIVIKPFKVKPQLPPDFEAATWEKLRDAVEAVFSLRFTRYSREELYRVRPPRPLSPLA
jgi:cullin-4